MNSARKALVLGANGQDGSYLSQALSARGLAVTSVGRQPQPRWPLSGENHLYRSCDIADSDALAGLLAREQPDFIFHFAAIHGPAGFDYEAVWQQAHLVNTVSVHAALEYIRAINPACGLVYASSSKVFGATLPATVTENSPRVSSCIYSTTKNAAHSLIDYYRARHGVAAAVLYLFNHESPRRSPSFFIPRIAAALTAARDGRKTRLHTLDFMVDWGDAREYMQIAAQIGERALGQDYILATGTATNAREMVSAFFRQHGFDYRDYIETETSGPVVPTGRADISRLRQTLGHSPAKSVLDVLNDMVHDEAGR